MTLVSKPELILLDIEGTTSSISFVKEFLFPYVKTNIRQYLDKNWSDPNVGKDIDLLAKQSVLDLESGLPDVPLITDIDNADKESVIRKVVDNVLWQMSTDRKTTALKQLQGNVWKFGYQSGDIKGHVYTDVPQAMAKWRALGIKICIYSSGSVLAQKLLFGHSLFGDLTLLIDNYFDTTVGHKTESESYTKICKLCDMNPKDVLFVTDIAKEAIAAKEAGLEVIISIREGTEPVTQDVLSRFKSVTSLDQVNFIE